MKPCRTLPFLIAVAALGALSACSKPQPPEKERPVEPQATQLREAIQRPLEQAKGSEDAVDQGAQRQRDAIDAAGG